MINFKEEILIYRDKITDDSHAVALYRALCNVKWKKADTDTIYSCSWRYAGGLIAKIRDIGEDYLDFYCAGGEGKIRNDILIDLNDIGWYPMEY